MDQIDLNRWLTGDDDIMDTLVGLASIPEEPSNNNHIQQNPGADILEYLLQTGNMDNSNSIFQPMNVQHTQPPFPPPPTSTAPVHTSSLQQTNQVTEQQSPAPTPIVLTDTMFRESVSVIHEKDNFVTFLPHSKPTNKKQNAPKKAKFKEPIFVTESPQSYKKKNKANVVNTSNHSSAEDNSDDDMMLEDELSSIPHNSNLKQMTSKERRQLRNKISARNFRVRRKEYITQLEEKVAEHEKTIDDLKKENEKLHQANKDIMKQLLVQPITPPPSSGDELLSASSSSGSEGHNSPDAQPPAYQFQLNDLYDFNLFDQQAQHAQQQQQQQQQQQPQYPNLFFLNHATMPDWDMTQVLSDKGKPVTTEEYQRELSRELISDYPLLAPALMSIVVRHTLSLEYVTALAKEFSDKIDADLVGSDHSKSLHTDEDQETLRGVDIDDLKASFNTLNIEDKEESEQDDDEEKTGLTELEIIKIMLTKYFRVYFTYRARGFTYDEIIAKCRPCLEGQCHSNKGKQKASSNKSNGMQTFQAYCRVAGNLLRHPHRMTRVSDVLKKEIDFTDNKQTARVQSHYKSLFGSQKSRITN